MKTKLLAFILSAIMALGVLSGCTGTAPAPEPSQEAQKEASEAPAPSEAHKAEAESSGRRTITDHFGNEVELPEKIERVAIVWLLPLPSVLAVYQGGNVDNLVGMPPDSLNAAENSILSKYCPEILEVSTDFYKGGELNMEELLNLKPDVVFYSGAARAELFKNAGIPAVGFSTTLDGNSSPINTFSEWIKLLEAVFQKESETTGLLEYTAEVEAEIARRVADIPEDQRKKVLMIGHYNDTAITPGGKGSFSEYWCQAVGAKCVALEAEQAEVNMEQIYEWAPDIVILSTLAKYYPDDLYNNTAGTGHDWSTVPAVQNKQAYKFPLGMHRWWPPSSDGALSLWWVAKTVYPELFEDIDINEKIKEYYAEFYDMELTDEDVDWILHPRDDLGRKFY